jgi:AraC-like DNA-binding protein
VSTSEDGRARPDVPVLRFSSDTFALKDRFEAYRDLYAGGTEVTRLGADFAAQFEARPLGELVIFERWLNDVAHERSAQRIRQDGFEHFVMQLNLSGVLVVETADGAAAVRPGEIIILDTGRPYGNRCGNAHVLTFSVARYVVERAYLGGQDLHGRILGAERGALLADFMASLTRNARTLSADAVNGMVGIFSELLTITLRPDDGTASAEARGKLKLAQELIEEGLSRHDLDPAVIAAKAGISRSRLYEMFKPHGGVASYIRRRRVHRFRALLSQRRDMRSIAELAFACGFASESHASRTFREVFAMPPGQFRRRQGGPALLPTVMAVVPGHDGFAPWVSSLNMRAQASSS